MNWKLFVYPEKGPVNDCKPLANSWALPLGCAFLYRWVTNESASPDPSRHGCSANTDTHGQLAHCTQHSCTSGRVTMTACFDTCLRRGLCLHTARVVGQWHGDPLKEGDFCTQPPACLLYRVFLWGERPFWQCVGREAEDIVCICVAGSCAWLHVLSNLEKKSHIAT